MHSLRIHTIEAPQSSSSAVFSCSSSSSAQLSSVAAADDSPSTSNCPHYASLHQRQHPPSDPIARRSTKKILEHRGVVHLYHISAAQTPSPSTSSSSTDLSSALPVRRSTLLYVVAVPSSLSIDEFLRFCCVSHSEHFLEVHVVRNDAIEDRYSVLIQVDHQKSADSFYLDFNGWKFPHAQQEEVCHALFVASVEYTGLAELAATPIVGSTELPTCPVCLERLDQDISGIATAGCDHSFQCSCISKWANLSCMVCQFCREDSDKPTCSDCGTSENLWICIICGFIGCGRYKEGHAIRHWKNTQHSYSLDLSTQRIWDYVGDTYVHRLSLSKSSGSMSKLKHRCRTDNITCETCNFNDDSVMNAALFGSKVDAVVEEYSRLLANQLENQRQYFEPQIIDANCKKEALISSAVEKAINEKIQRMQIEIEKLTDERNAIADMNEKLVKSQNLLKEKLREVEERDRLTLKMKDEKIRDLEEEIRDITVYIEAQKALCNVADADDIREGTVVSVTQQEAHNSSAGRRRTTRTSTRRR